MKIKFNNELNCVFTESGSDKFTVVRHLGRGRSSADHYRLPVQKLAYEWPLSTIQPHQNGQWMRNRGAAATFLVAPLKPPDAFSSRQFPRFAVEAVSEALG